jgi:hypothetical protein
VFTYEPQTRPLLAQVSHVVHVPFTQAMFVPHTVPLGSGLEPHVLFAHVAVAHGLLFGQTLPQAPQFWGLVAVLVSQPSAGLLLQSAKPALQATSWQVPPLQAPVPLAKLHWWPQAPQLLTSVSRLTQVLPQAVWPEGHWVTHTPL